MTNSRARRNALPVPAAALKSGLDGLDLAVDRVCHIASLATHCQIDKQRIATRLGHPPCVQVKNDEINVWVARNIRDLMDERGLKQQSLAHKAGVSQRTVGNFLQPAYRNETATGRPPSGTLANLAKIANALQVPAWQLTRPTSKAERELYERIEAAYRALVENAPPQQQGAAPPTPAPATTHATPAHWREAASQELHLPELDGKSSRKGGKAS